MGSYVPGTQEEKQEMLLSLGYTDMKDLYASIPGEVRLNRELNIPVGLSEFEVRDKLTKLAAKNTVFPKIFRGSGAYHHYIPAAVKQIVSKEEFITAYTPYQAEISQGTLQAIFEFQTMICDLTGMDVANASVYDGACAAAEAVIMCLEKKRTKVILPVTLSSGIKKTIGTYAHGTNTNIVTVGMEKGLINLEELNSILDDETACVVVQSPNYFGLLEDCEELEKMIHKSGAKFILCSNPISLGILKTPGEYKADIAVGEGQPLGLSLSFGGPYLGFMATTKELMRKLPGRIVGETKDNKGERAFVLTLQAREQHIRREKALSSICSNQALCALTASIYMSIMGKEGIRQAAILSMSKAHYLSSRLLEIEEFSLPYESEFFHEFITIYKGDSDKLLLTLEQHGILGGLPMEAPMEGSILWCATELNTKEDIDELINIIKMEVESWN
jgi:glycine dehydrogenase subunit 1